MSSGGQKPAQCARGWDCNYRLRFRHFAQPGRKLEIDLKISTYGQPLTMGGPEPVFLLIEDCKLFPWVEIYTSFTSVPASPTSLRFLQPTLHIEEFFHQTIYFIKFED